MSTKYLLVRSNSHIYTCMMSLFSTETGVNLNPYGIKKILSILLAKKKNTFNLFEHVHS